MRVHPRDHVALDARPFCTRILKPKSLTPKYFTCKVNESSKFAKMKHQTPKPSTPNPKRLYQIMSRQIVCHGALLSQAISSALEGVYKPLFGLRSTYSKP